MSPSLKFNFEFLKKAADLKKLSHAYIFSGNDVDAKNILLSSLLDYLGCKEVDILRISTFGVEGENSTEREIQISEIRNLKTFLSKTAWASPFKVAIIKDAEKMSQEAQSALLKILEEPTANTLIFLLTSFPALLLKTIISRAQEIRLYYFPSKTEIEKKIPKENITSLQILRTSTIAERFLFAKDNAESRENLCLLLESWAAYMRLELLKRLGASLPVSQISRFLQNIQTTLDLISHTNVNTRLAFEKLLLGLPE